MSSSTSIACKTLPMELELDGRYSIKNQCIKIEIRLWHMPQCSVKRLFQISMFFTEGPQSKSLFLNKPSGKNLVIGNTDHNPTHIWGEKKKKRILTGHYLNFRKIPLCWKLPSKNDDDDNRYYLPSVYCMPDPGIVFYLKKIPFNIHTISMMEGPVLFPLGKCSLIK